MNDGGWSEWGIGARNTVVDERPLRSRGTAVTAIDTAGVLGSQSVVLYALPELDGAIDSVVLGGLVPGGGDGDCIALIPERVRKLCGRIDGWVRLRRTPAREQRVAIALYGFPPNVGAVGTAALLEIPHSLDMILHRLKGGRLQFGWVG